jgi:hypothetical protein
MWKQCPSCQLWLFDRSTLNKHIKRKHKFEVSSSEQTENESSLSENDGYEWTSQHSSLNDEQRQKSSPGRLVLTSEMKMNHKPKKTRVTDYDSTSSTDESEDKNTTSSSDDVEQKSPKPNSAPLRLNWTRF